MRAGEIRGLRRSHIDRKANIICLPKELTKEKKAKRIPMNKYVREALQVLPVTVHLDVVFSYMGEPIINHERLKDSLVQACNKAGVPYGGRSKMA